MDLKSHSMLKTMTLFSICLLSFFSVLAQDDKQKSDFWKKVRFGGGVGISTANNVFSATLAPSAIYDFDSQFSLGITLNGTYFSQKNVAKSTILGAGVIGLYNPISAIQLSGEFEQNHVSRNFDNPNFIDTNYWVPSFFVGAGYRTRNITIGVRYDVLYDENKSVAANAWAPFVRVYF